MNRKEKSRFDRLYSKHLTALKLQGKADKTIEGYSRGVRRLASYFDRCPDNLTQEDLSAYFAALIESHSWSTVKIDRNGIAFFYRHVLEREMAWVGMVKPPVVKSLPDMLTCEELARIILRTETMRYRTFWFATYSMGLRLGETLNLHVGDIDSQRMRVHVRQGKGKKDRFVILPELTLKSLRRLWASHRHPRFLFPGRPGPKGGAAEHFMDRGSTQKAFARVVHDCGIHKHVSIHSLRHSYATRLVEAGLNLHGVQQLLGHASPQTTARYVRMTEKCQQDQASSVNRLADELASALRTQAHRS